MSRMSAFVRNVHVPIFRFLIDFILNFPVMNKLFPLNIYRSMNATLFPNCHLSINIFSRRLNPLTHLEKNYFVAFNDSETIVNESFI